MTQVESLNHVDVHLSVLVYKQNANIFKLQNLNFIKIRKNSENSDSKNWINQDCTEATDLDSHPTNQFYLFEEYFNFMILVLNLILIYSNFFLLIDHQLCLPSVIRFVN